MLFSECVLFIWLNLIIDSFLRVLVIVHPNLTLIFLYLFTPNLVTHLVSLVMSCVWKLNEAALHVFLMLFELYIYTHQLRLILNFGIAMTLISNAICLRSTSAEFRKSLITSRTWCACLDG